MKDLHNLPQIIDRQLYHLTADAKLLASIHRKQAQAHNKHFLISFSNRPILALCSVAILVVTLLITVPATDDASFLPLQAEQNMLSSHSAGMVGGIAHQAQISADLPSGTIRVGVGTESTSSTLFASGNASSYPLITIDDATYRMLTAPANLSASMLGEKLGTVNQFTLEPALASKGIVSNIAPTGNEVFAVGNMPKALIATTVEGAVRVFQRVSYANTAIIGKETLSDTLCDPSLVQWLSLEGVGTISNATQAQALMNTLYAGSDYVSTGMSGTRSFQIGLAGGVTLQMLVGEDTVSACGTWSAPDFFDEYSAIVSAHSE